MTVNYNTLWKLLIDLNMSKAQLRKKTEITTNVITNMGKMKTYQQKLLA